MHGGSGRRAGRAGMAPRPPAHGGSEDGGRVAAEAAATSAGSAHRSGSPRLTGTPIRSNPASSSAAMWLSRSEPLDAPMTTPISRTSPRTADVTRLQPEASM